MQTFWKWCQLGDSRGCNQVVSSEHLKSWGTGRFWTSCYRTCSAPLLWVDTPSFCLSSSKSHSYSSLLEDVLSEGNLAPPGWQIVGQIPLVLTSYWSDSSCSHFLLVRFFLLSLPIGLPLCRRLCSLVIVVGGNLFASANYGLLKQSELVLFYKNLLLKLLVLSLS